MVKKKMLFDNIPCDPHEVPCPLRKYTHVVTVRACFVVSPRLRDKRATVMARGRDAAFVPCSFSILCSFFIN